MIIHPIDLNSKLRPRPRNNDWMFFVNLALIGMFFLFFGSRFVRFPAIVINGDIASPASPASEVSYVPGSVVVSIKANGQIFTDTGLVSESQLNAWLAEKIKTSPDASLLIRNDAKVSADTLLDILFMARQAGFKLISMLVEPVPPDAGAPGPVERPVEK